MKNFSIASILGYEVIPALGRYESVQNSPIQEYMPSIATTSKVVILSY
jgi:hypothetical protein